MMLANGTYGKESYFLCDPLYIKHFTNSKWNRNIKIEMSGGNTSDINIARSLEMIIITNCSYPWLTAIAM